MLKIAAVLAGALLGAANAQAACGSSKADTNCVNSHLSDTKIILPGGVYSDPGGTAKKSAQDYCCYEKATKPAEYTKKYGGNKPSSATKQ